MGTRVCTCCHCIFPTEKNGWNVGFLCKKCKGKSKEEKAQDPLNRKTRLQWLKEREGGN